jgi:queuine tRNA-ribosyltransferase
MGYRPGFEGQWTTICLNDRSMSRLQFQLKTRDGRARRGRLTFPRGTVETPAFMPVGT